jgi:hypothetical protein
MADRLLYEKAATCYYQARLIGDAVRCYRLAEAYRRAADLNASMGEYREAAADYEQCGMPELAAWLLVHQAGDPAAARAVITRRPAPAPQRPAEAQPAAMSLRSNLVLAHCAVAEGALPQAILSVLDDACAELADPDIPYDRFVEEWAIALAEHTKRYDQAALAFAAAVRGGRRGAAERWTEWASRVLHAELTISSVPEPMGAS